jgi:hypothetical protein
MTGTAKERTVLRRLAGQVAGAAERPIQGERARLWKDFNGLRPARPMVLAFPEGGWRELVAPDDLECADPLLRAWEMGLRQTCFHCEHINDDRPITRHFDVGWVVRSTGLGLAETRIRTEELGSFRWDAPVKRAEDMAKLHLPEIKVDRAETARRAELAESIFGDLLDVRVHGSLWWTCGLTWTLINLRGLEQVMLDMYEDPALLHRLMAFLRDARLAELDAYEREGVLSLNNGPDDYVGSGGLGATRELPADGFEGRVRTRDMWVLGESQEFVGVGPALFEEFALEYQLPILSRFGLVCYGCCEPLDGKLDLIIRRVPRLRRVSISPWCDRAVAAERLGDRYVYSWKPNPAMVCGPAVDYDAVERTVRETLDIGRDCCLEMILKDTHTFQGDRRRVGKWVEIASRMAAE